MRKEFIWLSAADHIPARWDMRLIGWELGEAAARRNIPRLFDGRAGWRGDDWRMLEGRALTIAVGVDCAEDRAAMLECGFAEALPLDVALGELSVRLARVQLGVGSMPRQRLAGPVLLDLFHRDALVGERWLALHPREFALLWHLAEYAGGRVSRSELISEVWRLKHVPETNALEVHVSRLRAKLLAAGVSDLVATHPSGGYYLASGEVSERHWTGDAALRKVAAR